MPSDINLLRNLLFALISNCSKSSEITLSKLAHCLKMINFAGARYSYKLLHVLHNFQQKLQNSHMFTDYMYVTC